MLIINCENCIYNVWLVAIGQGVRCSHPENQKYKPKDANNAPVIISYIPKCDFYS